MRRLGQLIGLSCTLVLQPGVCPPIQLDLHNNKFNGALPAGWGNTDRFANLRILDVSGNALTVGPGRCWLAEHVVFVCKPFFTSLPLPPGCLQGPLPPAWGTNAGAFKKLEYLMLHRNQLVDAGGIPADWTTLNTDFPNLKVGASGQGQRRAASARRCPPVHQPLSAASAVRRTCSSTPATRGSAKMAALSLPPTLAPSTTKVSSREGKWGDCDSTAESCGQWHWVLLIRPACTSTPQSWTLPSTPTTASKCAAPHCPTSNELASAAAACGPSPAPLPPPPPAARAWLLRC